MSDSPPDLNLIARLLRQVLADIGSLRNDMAVQTVIIVRLDNTASALLTEIRAVHSQHSRLANRARTLEGNDA